MPQAAIFDVEGTLINSVDLHASAWQEALEHFGHHVTFEQTRSQIGKGGDLFTPVFLSEAQQRDHGKKMKEWRGELFKSKYLALVRPFSAVPELLRRVHDAGLKVAVASSAKASELEVYLEIACIGDLVDVSTSSEDAEQSKPAPDIFQVALKKLGIAGSDTVAIGDTPYDADAAGKAKISTIGLLCGGFTELELRKVAALRCIPGRLPCSPVSTPLHSAGPPHARHDGTSIGRFGCGRLSVWHHGRLEHRHRAVTDLPAAWIIHYSPDSVAGFALAGGGTNWGSRKTSTAALCKTYDPSGNKLRHALLGCPKCSCGRGCRCADSMNR